MKIAVVYNMDSENVINLFGVPSREKYSKRNIRRIVDALKAGGHQAISMEGDKDLIPRLEEFMPKIIKDERPGMVFNLSYGIQGQARYTHVPSILEMVGIPYIGSGPLAHSLALDKVVAKMIFIHQKLPTPEFAVISSSDFETPDIPFPLIIKPRNEAVSIGLKIVENENALRDAVCEHFNGLNAGLLIERYIDGREINVGLIGNSSPEPMPPAELIFGKDGPHIYTLEDKKGISGREVKVECPAKINKELTIKAQELAVKAFKALECFDCARVDMRLDHQGNLYILEINSLPSLGQRGSFVLAAEKVGLDFTALINRLVDEASSRYFGTPTPPILHPAKTNAPNIIFTDITKHRDRIEKSLHKWVNLSSRSDDIVGIKHAITKLDNQLVNLGLQQNRDLSGNNSVWMWETKKGVEQGTLIIGHIDIPMHTISPKQLFRRSPEWLYGEGIGSTRGPLVMMTGALAALRKARKLSGNRIGILYYIDEGQDCIFSREIITAAALKAKRVLVLRPGNVGNMIVTERRGQQKLQLVVEGTPHRLGKIAKNPDPLLWLCSQIENLSGFSSRKERVAISTADIRAESYPMLLPHRIIATILMSYPDDEKADELERKIRHALAKNGLKWELNMISDRPAMNNKRKNTKLAREIASVAQKWGITLSYESSVWPTAAGLVPKSVPVVCGVGPVARDLYTPSEAISRISLIQRTIILAQYLAEKKN